MLRGRIFVSDNFPVANALVGECGGYTVTMPGGKTLSSGICTRKLRASSSAKLIMVSGEKFLLCQSRP
jgi:hypothetical protein